MERPGPESSDIEEKTETTAMQEPRPPFLRGPKIGGAGSVRTRVGCSVRVCGPADVTSLGLRLSAAGLAPLLKAREAMEALFNFAEGPKYARKGWMGGWTELVQLAWLIVR